MKFTIGYRPTAENEPSLVDVAREFREHLSEVYFPWVGVPSGRSVLEADAQQRMEADLDAFRAMGLRLDLVLNASCYGHEAFSQDFVARVSGIIEHLLAKGGLDTVTTMSPLVAETVRSRFPGLGVRASVNMRLGTVRAMEQVAHLFDGFTVQREHNRDLDHLTRLKAWCDREGKSIVLLANSGCMAWCAVQTFHDNLVSHEHEIDPDRCAAAHIPGSCWQTYADRSRWDQLLQNTWIRPEDVRRYEPYAGEMKLATRMHERPRLVVRAYAQGRHTGNLLDLLEPSHTRLLAPWVIDNTRFPADWFDCVTAGNGSAAPQEYYDIVLQRVLVNTESPSADQFTSQPA